MKQYNIILAISKLWRKMESDKSRLSEEPSHVELSLVIYKITVLVIGII